MTGYLRRSRRGNEAALKFVGKLEVFRAAIDAGPSWLAVVAIMNAVISLYSYLRVLAPTVLDEGQRPAAPLRPVVGPALAVGLGVCAIAIVAFGVGGPAAAAPLRRGAHAVAVTRRPVRRSRVTPISVYPPREGA